jgi:hypothetical protein
MQRYSVVHPLIFWTLKKRAKIVKSGSDFGNRWPIRCTILHQTWWQNAAMLCGGPPNFLDLKKAGQDSQIWIRFLKSLAYLGYDRVLTWPEKCSSIPWSPPNFLDLENQVKIVKSQIRFLKSWPIRRHDFLPSKWDMCGNMPSNFAHHLVTQKPAKS